MDRASDSGSECWGFESLRPYQKERHDQQVMSFFLGFTVRGRLHSALTCCGLFVKMVLENRRGMSEYKLFCEEAYASQYKVSSETINRIVAHTQINSLFQQTVVI